MPLFSSRLKSLLLRLIFFNLCLVSVSYGEGSGYYQAKLCQLAAEEGISAELISEFYNYSEAKAKEQIEMPDEFWQWLGSNNEMLQGLLVGLHPEYNRHVITTLQELRNTFGREVEKYPHLALAFSFVYGAAKGESIRAPWMDWVEKNRPVPSCNDSFAYYVNNKDKLIYSLDHFPWPLMLYVADNDVPLMERQWVLSKYAGRSLASLNGIHSDPEYGGEAARKVAEYDGTPMALPRIFSDGGVCSQQAYYANSVFKCFGVPSVRLLERLHAYEGWIVENSGLKIKIYSAGGRKNGYYLCPLTRTKIHEFNFKLLVSAIDHSYDKYLKSKIACHVFRMLPEDTKTGRLLEEAIKNNPNVLDSWFEYSRACAEGVFSFKAGWKLYDRAKGILPEHPELVCLIMNNLTLAETAENQYRQIRNQFKATMSWLYQKKRLDLALDVYKTHADYLLKTKGTTAAINSSLAWLKAGSIPIDTQNKFFSHIHKIAIESKDNKALEKLLDSEYRRRFQLIRKCSEKSFIKHSRSYGQVAKAYMTYLNKTGDKAKASEIALESDSLHNKNLRLGNLPDVVTEGITLGVSKNQVDDIVRTGSCHVWRILYDLPEEMKICVQAKHAAAGKGGAFHLTAWSDSNGNGVPDTVIDTSKLMTADNKDQWSNWEFISKGKAVYVGIAVKTRSSIYYQTGGELEGYCGLSDRVFYSREFGKKPERSTRPRYANIRVEILKKRWN